MGFWGWSYFSAGAEANSARFPPMWHYPMSNGLGQNTTRPDSAPERGATPWLCRCEDSRLYGLDLGADRIDGLLVEGEVRMSVVDVGLDLFEDFVFGFAFAHTCTAVDDAFHSLCHAARYRYRAGWLGSSPNQFGTASGHYDARLASSATSCNTGNGSICQRSKIPGASETAYGSSAVNRPSCS